MTDKPRQRRNCRPTNATSRLNVTQLAALERFAPGFSEEYLRTHDMAGKPLPVEQITIPLRYIGDDRYEKKI